MNDGKTSINSKYTVRQAIQVVALCFNFFSRFFSLLEKRPPPAWGGTALPLVIDAGVLRLFLIRVFFFSIFFSMKKHV